MGQKLNLVSVYAPPGLHDRTFADLGELLLTLPPGRLLIGGDFNSLISTSLDRWPPKDLPPSRTKLHEFLDALALSDAWRELHPEERQYTFYSHPHRSSSRIDYILVPPHQLINLKEVKHLASGISDHSPIYCHIEVGEPLIGRVAPIHPWHFQSPQIRHALHTATKLYFEENTGSVTSPRSLWEAYKAVIRGAILAKISGLRKEAQAALRLLEEQILELQNYPKGQDSDITQHQLEIKTKEFTDLATDAARTHYRATCNKIYDVGDKAGKLLAWLDRKKRTQRVVTETEENSTAWLTDPQDIAVPFGRYFQDLYTTLTPHAEEEGLSLLQGIPLPSLTEEETQDLETQDLEADITATEVENAIQSLNSGKVSGPKGLPIELFKLVASKIAPHLVDMFTESQKVGILLEDQRLANIVTIHKERKPRHKCTSYTPISLLNCEAKVLARVLVKRLLKVITKLVHPDQSGFIPARNTALNLRRLNGVLSRASTIQEEAVIVSLDAASDAIEWPCMFAALRKRFWTPIPELDQAPLCAPPSQSNCKQ